MDDGVGTRPKDLVGRRRPTWQKGGRARRDGVVSLKDSSIREEQRTACRLVEKTRKRMV